MPAKTVNPSLDDAAAKTTSPSPTPANGTSLNEERRFADLAEMAKASIAEAAVRAQRAVQESLEALRANSRTYVDTAGERADVAQKYVVERVKERPVTATLAGLGVGLLLGLLLAGRGKNSR